MQNTPTWQILPSEHSTSPNCVDIIQCDLLINPHQQDVFWDLLNQEEQTTAQRFHFSQHRRRYIAARAYLRKTLSVYLNIDPSKISFNYTDHGKPYLASEQNPNDLRFNVSHSREVALYAITQDIEIGVDIEHERDRNIIGIAQRFFSSKEQDQLLKLPEEEQFKSFFHIWAQKEAMIKAIGQGLSYPLDSFSVNAVKPAKLIEIEGDEPQRWYLHDFFVADKYASALATRQSIHQINYWRI